MMFDEHSFNDVLFLVSMDVFDECWPSYKCKMEFIIRKNSNNLRTTDDNSSFLWGSGRPHTSLMPELSLKLVIFCIFQNASRTSRKISLVHTDL